MTFNEKEVNDSENQGLIETEKKGIEEKNSKEKQTGSIFDKEKKENPSKSFEILLDEAREADQRMVINTGEKRLPVFENNINSYTDRMKYEIKRLIDEKSGGVKPREDYIENFKKNPDKHNLKKMALSDRTQPLAPATSILNSSDREYYQNNEFSKNNLDFFSSHLNDKSDKTIDTFLTTLGVLKDGETFYDIDSKSDKYDILRKTNIEGIKIRFIKGRDNKRNIRHRASLEFDDKIVNGLISQIYKEMK